MSLSREEIIRMAREAGFPLNETSSRKFQYQITEVANAAFAAGAAAEREACAKLCDQMHSYSNIGCAAAIRSRRAQ